MCPIAESDGHDGPRLGLELVPSIAAVIEQSRLASTDVVENRRGTECAGAV